MHIFQGKAPEARSAEITTKSSEDKIIIFLFLSRGVLGFWGFGV
jgi:hypothetical protein